MAPKLVGSAPEWGPPANLRVSSGFVTWAEPTLLRVRAVPTSGGVGVPLSETTGTYARFGLAMALFFPQDGGRLGIIRVPSTAPTFPEIDDPLRMILRPVRQEATYVGLSATELIFNDDESPFPLLSMPIAGGRPNVLSEDLRLGAIETSPLGTYYYAVDRQRADGCGLYGSIGTRIIPDDDQCRSSSGAIRVAPGFVLWQRIDANSMQVLAVLRGSDGRVLDLDPVRRHFAAHGGYVYFQDATDGLSRTPIDGDGTAVEPLGVRALNLVGLEPGDDGHLYWLTHSNGTTALYRMPVP